MVENYKNKGLSELFENQEKMLENGNGLSFFDIDDKNSAELLRHIDQVITKKYEFIKLSDIDSFKYSNKPLVIYQNLDYEEFLKHGVILVDKVIFPAWFNNTSIFFISSLSKDDYFAGKIDSRLVHQDLKRISQLLSSEQMISLLDKVNHSYSVTNRDEFNLISNPVHIEVDDKFESNNKQSISLESLNKEQEKAVNHLNGPMRVLAPAGSGKTKTLVNRIVSLVNQGINSNEILALAFNKKAQSEMLERLNINFGINNVDVSTFHAFGNKIIQETLHWRFNGKQEIMETRRLLNQALVELNQPMTFKRNTDPLNEYMDLLSKSKNELFSEKQMQVIIDDEKVNFLVIFNEYILSTAKERFYNYDDMIYLSLRKLLSDPKMRHEIQSKYKYILVDEFQDLNKAQLLLLQIISLPENNVFVCGDDDQMIYSFRGAEVENILSFNHHHSEVKDQVLEINYRSSSNIVKHSKWLIDNNKNRVFKNITPFKEKNGNIDLFIGESLKEQAEKIVEWIMKLKEEGKSWSDFAILYRYNEYRDLLFMVLTKHKIPVDDRRVTILNTRVGRTLMAYLTIIYDKENSTQDHFAEILKKPNKYLTNDFISTVRSWDDFIDTRRGRTYLHRNSFDNYTDFVAKIQNFKLENKTPVQIINSIIQTFGFREEFNDNSKKIKDNESATDLDILEIIVGFAATFDSIGDFYNFFLDTKKNNMNRNREIKSNDVVHLTTVHKTKGNEYKNVAYYNLNETPTKEVNQKEYEEERRIAYVAMTRAENNLLVTTQKGDLSPFIKEMFLNPNYSNENVRSLKEKIRAIKLEKQTIEALDQNDDKNKINLDDLRLLEIELKNRQKILNSMRQGR